MIDPDVTTFIAVAAPWSPPTAGVVTAEVVAVRGFASESEFEPLRGKLRGKIVLLGRAPGPPDIIPIDKPLFQRLDERQLAEHARPETESSGTGDRENEKAFAHIELAKTGGRFLASEGVRAVIVPSGDRPTGGSSGGTLWADGNAGFGWLAYQKEHAMHVPLVIIANEHYDVCGDYWIKRPRKTRAERRDGIHRRSGRRSQRLRRDCRCRPEAEG